MNFCSLKNNVNNFNIRNLGKGNTNPLISTVVSLSSQQQFNSRTHLHFDHFHVYTKCNEEAVAKMNSMNRHQENELHSNWTVGIVYIQLLHNYGGRVMRNSETVRTVRKKIRTLYVNDLFREYKEHKYACSFYKKNKSNQQAPFQKKIRYYHGVEIYYFSFFLSWIIMISSLIIQKVEKL